MISSKLPGLGTTIFTVMSQLSAEYRAVNLGQGFPDYEMNPLLQQEVSKALTDGYNQYVHMAGYAPLREALAEKINRLYGAGVQADAEITITPGATYSIFCAITACIGKGDEVIVFEPAYDSYIPNIELNGGVAVTIPLQKPSYQIPWPLVEAAITPRTKMIIVNSPHNPTGRVLSEADLLFLQALAEKYALWVVADEVYEHLIFDGLAHHSVLKYEGLRQRSFACYSFGKVYHCTGWKLGYCVAPKALTAEFRKVHQFNSFTCNSFVQVGLHRFLQYDTGYEALGSFLQTKRNFLRQLLVSSPFKPLGSSGSYFELYDYAAISQLSENELAIQLIKEAGVATIPVSAFYRSGQNNQVLRFCFAKKEETLEQAAHQLMTWANKA